MALGGSIHVVPDADGLFQKTLHAAEVDAAVNKVLHSTAGILHCVNGSLALLLPSLHVSLMLGQLRQRAAHVLLQPVQGHGWLIGQDIDTLSELVCEAIATSQAFFQCITNSRSLNSHNKPMGAGRDYYTSHFTDDKIEARRHSIKVFKLVSGRTRMQWWSN